jgi:hypothetical protein
MNHCGRRAAHFIRRTDWPIIRARLEKRADDHSQEQDSRGKQ